MQYATTAERIGTQKGRQRGRQEAQRQSLEQLLTARFGRLPVAVTARLAKAESGQLTAWFHRALTASLLDEVFAECPAVERSHLKG